MRCYYISTLLGISLRLFNLIYDFWNLVHKRANTSPMYMFLNTEFPKLELKLTWLWMCIRFIFVTIKSIYKMKWNPWDIIICSFISIFPWAVWFQVHHGKYYYTAYIISHWAAFCISRWWIFRKSPDCDSFRSILKFILNPFYTLPLTRQ